MAVRRAVKTLACPIIPEEITSACFLLPKQLRFSSAAGRLKRKKEEASESSFAMAVGNAERKKKVQHEPSESPYHNPDVNLGKYFNGSNLAPKKILIKLAVVQQFDHHSFGCKAN